MKQSWMIAVGFPFLLLSCPNGFAALKPSRNDLTRGLIHWWKFNGNADDSTGDLSATPIGPISYVPAVAGLGIAFDGTNTGISLPPIWELQFRSSFSISVWAKLNIYPPYDRIWATIIFDGDDRNGLDPWDLQVSPSGYLQFLVTSAKVASGLNTPAQFPLGKFVFVAATYDQKRGVQRLYIDGVPVAEKDRAWNLTPVVNLVPGQYAGIGIGTNNGFPKSMYNMGWNGVISDLRIYDRPLSEWEVLDSYCRSLGLRLRSDKD